MQPIARSTVHVATYPRWQLWRILTEPAAIRRWLARAPGTEFTVVGRASGGRGRRHVNRTLSATRTVVLVEWTDAPAAMAGRAQLDGRWARAGARTWSATLVPHRADGRWRGATPFRPVGGDHDLPAGPVASLTYAQVRPARMGSFYVRAFPKSARDLARGASPALAAVGFGDVPVRHACTFSLWPDERLLLTAVHGRSGPHAEVARCAVAEGWLSESLFARFAVADHHGDWGDGDPLAEP